MARPAAIAGRALSGLRATPATHCRLLWLRQEPGGDLSRTCLINATLLDPEAGSPHVGRLLLEGGRIAAVLRDGQPAPADARTVDLAGAFVAPGFLDLHDHGTLVFPPYDSARSALEAASVTLARHGTTAFLPTTVSLPADPLAQLVSGAGRAIEQGGFAGALPIGLHLEGPWISTAAAGAHAPPAIRAPAHDEIAQLLEGARGLVRMVTFAPETDGVDGLLTALTRARIVPAVGHTAATPDQMERAVAGGAHHVTHLFNAMSGLHHRTRGVAGFALADDRLTCDLICDGVHVHPDVVRVAARAKGDRLVLITDRVELPVPSRADDGPGTASVAVNGLEAAFFAVDGLDGVAIRLRDGTLAGSRLTLDRAMQNFRAFAGTSLLAAVAACTLRPARVLGIESERGTLRPGARADLAILDADTGAVRETWIGGAAVYRAASS